MSTIVYLHAHPDDESSQTAGTMARATDDGHRVVVVFATDGRFGEVPGDLADGETLVMRRRREAERAAEVLALSRIEWLGYRDSGMTGWEQNVATDSFLAAELDEAAGRLVAILDDEHADVLVGYDWHGGYGHPDHIKVHQTVHRAAELARHRPRLLESTMNRDAIRASRERWSAALGPDATPPEFDFDPDQPMDDGHPLGEPESAIHWAIDVSSVLARKRAAMEAHASQTTDIGAMLAMPEAMFATAFGTEYLIEPGRPPGMVHGWPF